jgi:hypothetical protein
MSRITEMLADPANTPEVLLIGVCLGLMVICVVCLIQGLRAPPQHFQQRDWVADQKRRVTHRGFKSRMGAR